MAGDKLTIQDSVGDDPGGIGLSRLLLMFTDKGVDTEKGEGINSMITSLEISNHKIGHRYR